MRRTIPFHPRWVFLDTGGYYGLLNRRDQNRQAATTIYQRLGTEHWRLFRTNFILAELHALMLSKVGRQPARQALAFIQESQATTIVRVSPADEQRALEILDQYDPLPTGRLATFERRSLSATMLQQIDSTCLALDRALLRRGTSMLQRARYVRKYAREKLQLAGFLLSPVAGRAVVALFSAFLARPGVR